MRLAQKPAKNPLLKEVPSREEVQFPRQQCSKHTRFEEGAGMIAYKQYGAFARHIFHPEKKDLPEIHDTGKPRNRPQDLINHVFSLLIVCANVNKYLVVLAGPTAVGKTDLAIRLAQRFDSVIISADSRQVYREMSIGTAKPTTEQRALVPHDMIDVVSVMDHYSAGDYSRECQQVLQRLFKNSDCIFLVGGSGLYIHSVIDGFDKIPRVSAAIRQSYEELYRSQGIAPLQELIRLHDPAYAARVDMRNPHRLIRALSVIETTGAPFSKLHHGAHAEKPFQVIRILLNLPRQELYARIHRRVDDMMTQGLLEEVRALLKYRDTPVMHTVGYRELIAYCDGHMTLEEAIDKIKQHSCNYAKRQLTWFRHQGTWTEFNPPDIQEIEKYITGHTGITPSPEL
jgi:tRNA dimethylallyltransferase